MDDLISRKAAMKMFTGMPPDFYHTSYIVGEINSLPSVNAVPVVHGRWLIRESGPGEIECKCSVCKYRDFVPRNDVYWVNRKFCPNCGARMDGDADG